MTVSKVGLEAELTAKPESASALDAERPFDSQRRYTPVRQVWRTLGNKIYQSLAILVCCLFGLALIINNELSGEASWFWYARLLHSGSKLYADLHLPLQPLMVLEMDAWMRMFGTKCVVYHIPAVIHLVVLVVGLYLLLRESDWSDWQKAIVITGSFVFWICGPSYRFDDYHVTTESFILYSLLLLILLAKTDNGRRQIALVLGLGVLSGLTATSRLNDGAALVGATAICLPVLARSRKLLLTCLFIGISALTLLAIIRCTGDSFSVYVASTLTKAVGSKGGGGTILSNPFHLFINAERMRHGFRWLFLTMLVVAAAGAVLQRFGKQDLVDVLLGEIAIVLTFLSLGLHGRLDEMTRGALIDFVIPCLVVITYVLAVLVLVRAVLWLLTSGRYRWETREVLILVPLAELMSNAASSAGEPRSGYYAPLVLLLLLLPLLQPYRKQVVWANAWFLTLLISIAVSETVIKAHMPYFWDSMRERPLFVGRQWYHHPIYGTMYIQTDLLQFSKSVCNDIGGIGSHPELLSLPFPYPNYFCDAPPWHGYVQTFIDITARSTMDKLMSELLTSPPQWIVYQRQLGSLDELESAFNHGRPSPQRDLDRLIVNKIAAGQWHLVDFKHSQYGEGWYIIRTRP